MEEVAELKSIGQIAMPELEAVPDISLRAGLRAGFEAARANIQEIEDCFKTVTGRRGSVDERRTFFRSWNMTNNSAMCVSGQTNRISAMALKPENTAQGTLLLNTIASLHRITDEDLAVGSGILHADLFYNMATYYCEGDDWLGHRYLLSEARAFKEWRDRKSLHHSDIWLGLMITLVHEIYTHCEVEYILPMFKTWANRYFEPEGRSHARNLAWISVHCNGTETRHFSHALEAVRNYARATEQEFGDQDITETVLAYISNKADCMRAIKAHYSRGEA